MYTVIETTRSSLPAALAAERARIAAVARMAGAEVAQPADYPGWAPNPQSPLLGLTKDVLRKVGPRGGGRRVASARALERACVCVCVRVCVCMCVCVCV